MLNVFEQMTNSIRAGSTLSSVSASCTPSMFETQCSRRLRLRSLESYCVAMTMPSPSCDANVDDIRERLADPLRSS